MFAKHFKQWVRSLPLFESFLEAGAVSSVDPRELTKRIQRQVLFHLESSLLQPELVTQLTETLVENAFQDSRQAQLFERMPLAS